MNDQKGQALRALGDRMDNAQIGAAGRFWQLCEAQEKGENPSADKRVLVGLVGRRVVRVMFGVLVRELTRSPALFSAHVAALANGMVREVGESLQTFPFAERLNAFNGLVAQLAAGLQLGIAEKVEAPPAAPTSPLADREKLRALVDAVWNHVTESQEVPSTTTADRLIDEVFGGAP